MKLKASPPECPGLGKGHGAGMPLSNPNPAGFFGRRRRIAEIDDPAVHDGEEAVVVRLAGNLEANHGTVMTQVMSVPLQLSLPDPARDAEAEALVVTMETKKGPDADTFHVGVIDVPDGFGMRADYGRAFPTAQPIGCT
ncbi:hypothetical protein [Methylobacterium sp. Gmos1]